MSEFSDKAGRLKRVEQAYKHKCLVTGRASGLRDLDALTGGFQASELIIIAARPSLGKPRSPSAVRA